MKKYTYQVTTSNGAGVHSEHTRLADAKAAAAGVAKRFPRSAVEIERVEHFDNGARGYWMRRRARWVPWDALGAENGDGPFCSARCRDAPTPSVAPPVSPPDSSAIQLVRDCVNQAIGEPHGPDVDALIDAVRELTIIVEELSGRKGQQ